MSIKAVIFDLDGTLVAFPRQHLFSTARAVFAELAITGISDEEMDDSFAAFDFFRRVPESQRAKAAEYLSRELERIGHPLLELFPDTLQTLEELKGRGYSLAIATARIVPEPQLRASLEKIGIAHFFEEIAVRSADSHNWKDKSAQFVHLSECLKLEPAQLCFVSDIPSDIDSAKRSGLGLSIAVLSGGIRADVLQAAAPDYLLRSIGDLLAGVEELFAGKSL